MGEFVIAAYRPRPGREKDLLAEVRRHLPTLRAEGLVTDRPSLVMRAKDGTLLEIFEWKSAQAIDQAHANKTVQAMWERFGKACEYVPLASLEEAQGPFAPFVPVEF